MLLGEAREQWDMGEASFNWQSLLAIDGVHSATLPGFIRPCVCVFRNAVDTHGQKLLPFVCRTDSKASSCLGLSPRSPARRRSMAYSACIYAGRDFRRVYFLCWRLVHRRCSATRKPIILCNCVMGQNKIARRKCTPTGAIRLLHLRSLLTQERLNCSPTVLRFKSRLTYANAPARTVLVVLPCACKRPRRL